jgi:translation initiation factor IF-2
LTKRFYHIALELGVSPREFIRELAEAGLSVGNQMVVIPGALEDRIRVVHDKLRPAPEPAVATAVLDEEPPVLQEATEADVVDASDVAEAVEAVEAAPEDRHETPAAAEIAAPVVDVPDVVEAEEVAEPVAEAPEPVETTPVAASLDGSAAGDAPAAVEEQTEETTQRRIRQGVAPKPLDLVPTLDPRAGRLIKEAPRGGVPGVTTPPRARGGGADDIRNLNPTIPQSDRAPGVRRDSHRRSTIPERFRGKRGKETFHMRRRSRKRSTEPARPRPTAFEVEPPISVKKFSEQSGYKAAEILKILFKNHGMMINVNTMLPQDTLELLALELELDLTFVKKETAEDALLSRVEAKDNPDDLRARPPVVTILGHVDHGKTTLLDKIRASDVAAHEAGGITQHISASQVNLPDGRKVTFIDTPGHEAFTEMRARGAQVTDVVILIVAADDGVMPQTIESISHVKAAGAPMVVAITKVDKDNAQPTRVRQQLAEHEVYVEGYGGDVSAFDVSGITGEGVPELLEHLALMAEVEVERFQANPQRASEGTVIESENSPQRGVVATVLVQNGTLHRGDPVLAGESYGSVRAMFNYRGEQVDEALPGDPVEIIGLDQPPEAGSKFYVVEETNKARGIAEIRRSKSRERELAAQSKPTTIESLLGAISEGKIQELNVVLKADVKGSLEPIKGLLSRIGTEEVRVKVIHSAVGGVNDSDVILASASDAWIIGFDVNVDDRARDRAKMAGVEIRIYRIIYDIEKDVRAALEGKLAPEEREVVLGHAEILQLFSSSRLGTIAGCRIRDGIIRRDARIRVKRGADVVHTAKMASLRREKDEVREVKEGFECGIRLEGWDAFEQGDELEAFVVEEVRRTLE